jgi:hypothetical protein
MQTWRRFWSGIGPADVFKLTVLKPDGSDSCHRGFSLIGFLDPQDACFYAKPIVLLEGFDQHRMSQFKQQLFSRGPGTG